MAKKLCNVTKITREEWLEYRRKGIGGSDAASVVGLSPYRGRFALWADKKGLLDEKEDNEQMRQGRDLEEYVAQRFCEATGKKVRRNNYMYRHDLFDFLQANIDREIVGENAGLECKTTSVYNKHDFEGGEVPLVYYCQCMHYMAVMGYDRMYLAVLVLNKGFYWFTIERDEQEIKNLMQAEFDFWMKNVVANVQPEADGNEDTKKVLAKVFPAQNAHNGQAFLYEFDSAMTEYSQLQKTIKELTYRADEIKNQMVQALGNSTYGLLSNYSVSNKVQSKTTVDTDMLKSRYPDIYEECKKTSEYKVFRTTSLKNKEK